MNRPYTCWGIFRWAVRLPLPMMGKMPTGMIMALNNNLPYRRSIRLAEYDYRQPGAYFITVCTHGRAARFGTLANGRMHLNDAGQVLHTIWQALPEHYPGIALDAFVVMPDHIHGIIVINEPVRAIHESPGCFTRPQWAIPESPLRLNPADRRTMTLPKLMGRLKMQTAKQINALCNTPGQPLWQRNYWERILRDERECAAVRAYIRTNPQRG
jgi:putative transposase